MYEITKDDAAVWLAYINSPCLASSMNFKRKTVYWNPILDLHGYSIHEAYNKTKEHLAHSISLHHKKATIITGKSGIIKQEFVFWIEPYRSNFKIISRNSGGSWLFKAK